MNFNKNEDHNKLLVSKLIHKFAKVKQGGGEKRIKKLHAEGKMTARERIDYLLDKDRSIEIGGFVGEGMYEEYGGCPSGGVIVKIGNINGKQCIVVKNDATVKAGRLGYPAIDARDNFNTMGNFETIGKRIQEIN